MNTGLRPPANWLLGNSLANEDFIFNYSPLPEATIKLEGGMDIHVVNGNKCRVVAANISWLQDPNSKHKASGLIYFKMIQNFLKQSSSKQSSSL